MDTTLVASPAFLAALWLTPEIEHRICSFHWPQLSSLKSQHVLWV